jgi:hypothetical protein
LNADIDRKKLRGVVGDDCRYVWGKWVIVGQDGEDAGSRGAEEFPTSEDADGDAR